MILTPHEIDFLDVYCHEGTQPPFGGPATDVLRGLGVHNGDTLNIQWAYLRDQPPAGPVIGRASQVAPPLPWCSREAVLRRDAEIRKIREQAQGAGVDEPGRAARLFAALDKARNTESVGAVKRDELYDRDILR
jgi:hypothetical protein